MSPILNPINLDVNSSLGVSSLHLSELIQNAPMYQNPSAVHSGGQRAKIVLENSRSAVAQAVNAPLGSTIIFTSGATESNALVFHSLLNDKQQKNPPQNIVVSAVEHSSVLEHLDNCRLNGYEIRVVSPSKCKFGEITPQSVASLVDSQTKLVSIMTVNNETGVIHPITEIVRAVKAINSEVIFHTDAVQAFGKIPWSFKECRADIATLSGHKVGALTGVGVLLVRKGLNIKPIFKGGFQEGGKRAGTENIVAILSLGLIAPKVAKATQVEGYIQAMWQLRASFLKGLSSSGCTFEESVSSESSLVPNTVSVRFTGVRADDLVIACDLEGIWISGGAACSSGKQSPSGVLLALGHTEEFARETVRISFASTYSQDVLNIAGKKIGDLALRMQHKLGTLSHQSVGWS